MNKTYCCDGCGATFTREGTFCDDSECPECYSYDTVLVSEEYDEDPEDDPDYGDDLDDEEDEEDYDEDFFDDDDDYY